MILQALYDLAEQEGLVADPDFEVKPVAYRAIVGRDGTSIRIVTTKEALPAEGTKKPRVLPKQFEVAREPGRTSGARATFLVDKAEYAFGIDPDGKRSAEQLEQRFALFRDRVRECHEATADEHVGVLLKALEGVARGEIEIELPADVAGNDLFGFVHVDEAHQFILHRKAVRKYWRGLRKQGEVDPEQPRCLVSGKISPPVKNHPTLQHIPGASSSGVPLVSFNSKAFESYGWSGNDNASVSRDAAEQYATALRRLLHPAPPNPNDPDLTLPRRNLRIGGDSVVCYWAPENQAFADAINPMMEGEVDESVAHPEEVERLYRSVWEGRHAEVEDPSRFYALVLAGAQGRVVVRSWLQMSVGEAQRHLTDHFRDLRLVRNTPKPKNKDLKPHLGLNDLLRSLAVQGKWENVPSPLASHFVQAILQGTAYPLSALQRALLRYRAEIGNSEWTDFVRRDAQVALIKAVLNRRLRFRQSQTIQEEVQPAMDPNNTNTGYLLGRLMALYERLQQLALNDVNASVVDRYFSSASASPKSVFIRLARNARHHAKKAKDDARAVGRAVNVEKMIDAIYARLGHSDDGVYDMSRNGFPSRLSLEDQGLFVIGYHQQRHDLFNRPETVSSEDEDTAESNEN